MLFRGTLEQRRPYFSYGRKLNYICTCTVKLYDILKVKNALVKSKYASPTTPLAGLLKRLNPMDTRARLPQQTSKCNEQRVC